MRHCKVRCFEVAGEAEEQETHVRRRLDTEDAVGVHGVPPPTCSPRRQTVHPQGSPKEGFCGGGTS